MSSFIAFLKRWYPSIILGVTALWGVFGTGIQHAISANPKLYLALTTALGILMHLLPSPLPPTAAVRAQVRKMAQAGIVMVLCVCMLACNTPTWVQDAEKDIPEVISIIVEILPLISAAEGGATIPPQINTDLALAQDLAAKIAKGNNDALIPQLQNAIAAAQSDIDGILAALHVTNTKDATTNAKRAGKMSSTSLDRL